MTSVSLPNAVAHRSKELRRMSFPNLQVFTKLEYSKPPKLATSFTLMQVDNIMSMVGFTMKIRPSLFDLHSFLRAI